MERPHNAMMEDLQLGRPAGECRAVVAMSGGVDSSCAAALLLEAGCEVIGVTLQLYDHGAALGKAVYIILDQVGAGHITWLSVDGLILKHATHPLALDLARRTSAALPEIEAEERPGVAYTDAVVATRRGAPALTLSAIPREGGAGAHWHQMSDRVDVVQRSSLADACAFAWHVLRQVDDLNE